MCLRLPLVLLALSLMATDASGQIVREMTPQHIGEAIALGTTSEHLAPYPIQERARSSWPPQIGVYTTPFLRVALAAHTAKQRGGSFTEANVSAEMLAPLIYVYASAPPLQGAAGANVVSVVILPRNAKDLSQAVQPTSVHPFGFVGQGQNMLAIFPLAVWREHNDIHVIFDKEIQSSRGPQARGGCTDCRSRIYLENIR